MEWECGVSRCKLVYGRWINSNVLLYSTANYIQYPVINHNGKEYAKECIYICMTDSLYCIAEMNTIVNPLYLHKIKKIFNQKFIIP